MQDEVTIEGLIIYPLKGWNTSNNLGSTLTNHNSIQEKINSSMKPESAFNYSVQNLSRPD